MAEKTIVENINLIGEYTESINSLAVALQKHLQKFENVHKLMDKVQGRENEIQRKMDAIAVSVQDGAKELNKNTQLLHSETHQQLMETSVALKGFVEEVEGRSAELHGRLGQSAESLKTFVEDLSHFSGVFNDVLDALQQLPYLIDVSENIRDSLDIIRNVEGLEEISQRLVQESAEIKAAKEEILEPLANAAKFTDTVDMLLEQRLEEFLRKMGDREKKVEKSNAHLLKVVEERFQTLVERMDQQESKAEELVAEGFEELRAEIAEWVPQEEDKEDDGVDLSGVETTVRALYDLTPDPVLVVKNSWSGDYCMHVRDIRNNKVFGDIYLNGIYSKGNNDNRADLGIFTLYDGPSRNLILLSLKVRG